MVHTLYRGIYLFYVMKELKEFLNFSIFSWIESNDESGI